MLVAVAVAVGAVGAGFGFHFCCGFLVEASVPVKEGGEGTPVVLGNGK